MLTLGGLSGLVTVLFLGLGLASFDDVDRFFHAATLLGMNSTEIMVILVFSLVAIVHPNWFWLVVSRLLGVPVIAGIGYEWIRLMARNRYNPVVKVMLLPVLVVIAASEVPHKVPGVHLVNLPAE